VVPVRTVIPRPILMRRTREIAWRKWLKWRIWYPLGYQSLRIGRILHVNFRMAA